MSIFDDPSYFALGVNYWPRKQATRMWRDFDPEGIAAELGQMAELGMNAIRAFVYIPDFAPTSHHADPLMLARLSHFLDLCAQARIKVHLSPIVGHMSGENWQIPWQRGRSFFADESFAAELLAFIQQVARHVARHAALETWVISNELPLYAGHTDNASGTRWAQQVIAALREADPHHPVGLGDGAWNALGEQNGLPVEQLAPALDFLGPHTYPWDTDSLRHSYMPAFLVRLLQAFGRPVLLEEFGCSNTHASERHQADYYRTTMHSCLLGGARGIFSWCYSDFDLPHQRPYSHHSFELRFGVTRADGSVKPAGEEFGRLARAVAALNAQPVRPQQPQARIVLPSALHTPYPWAWWRGPEEIWRPMLEALILSRQAGLETAFWAEPALPSDGVERAEEAPAPIQLPDDVKLLYVPAAPALTAPTWEALATWVREGGTLYLSFRQGMWIHNLERLTGCEHQLRFGVPTQPGAAMEWRWERSFGAIQAGTVWRYQVAGEGQARAMCPVQPVSALVLARDAQGRPAVLLNQLGQGQVLFVTYPLEYYLASTPDVHDADTSYRLYDALATLAGSAGLVKTRHPALEIGVFRRETDALVWVINHSWGAVETRLELDLPLARLQDVLSGQPCEPYIALEPKGVRVFRLSYR